MVTIRILQKYHTMENKIDKYNEKARINNKNQSLIDHLEMGYREMMSRLSKIKSFVVIRSYVVNGNN